MGLTTLGLALAAGVLSTLSPCVLPLIPIVLGTALAEHRWAPVALATGLALSFAVIGLFVATIGFAIGLDADVFRIIAALLLITFGVILVVPRLQERVTMMAAPLSNWADTRMGAVTSKGLSGQFLVGVLLGAVWTPCAGPTLGAASLLASRGQNLVEVAGTMLMFGIGAALPLLVFGLLSRQAMLRLRTRAMSAGYALKAVLGVFLAVIGLGIVTGWDKPVETWLLDRSPAWLTELTTSI